MLLELKNVCYTYNKDTSFSVNALENINLQIPEGQFVGVIGHTGSGKSTLIQHFNGLIRPTDGQVLYMGEDIWQEKYNLQALRSGVGLVFQYPENQLFETDVLTDVMFGPKNQKLSPEECRERAVNALHRVGLKDKYFTASPFDLSGGQKRRVAIAGVIAMEPEVLILDEPTAGLDPVGREGILENIRAYQKARNATIMMVSHSMSDVARLTDRLLVMNGSRLAMDGTPEEIFVHAQQLLDMGLDIPDVTRVFLRLKAMGLDVDPVYSIDQAVAALKKLKEGGHHA
jgi:energy-coupling factor transport system ATP-binding protein